MTTIYNTAPIENRVLNTRQTRLWKCSVYIHCTFKLQAPSVQLSFQKLIVQCAEFTQG